MTVTATSSDTKHVGQRSSMYIIRKTKRSMVWKPM